MSIIEVTKLTKDYGRGRGVFDVTFAVKEGETFGFLGPNGAGKTTTIRHIMGFNRPRAGKTTVFGKDSWTQQQEIQKSVGYLPAEIAFPDYLTGKQFIKMMAEFRELNDLSYANNLAERFKLDTSINLKRMSFGTKRKIAIVVAFMHNPKILLLDEPTSGLDPVMRSEFLELINEEKEKGKTILMSSHLFDEVERSCDFVAIIKEGKIIAQNSIADIMREEVKEFKLEFMTSEDYERFASEAGNTYTISSRHEDKNQMFVKVEDKDINRFIRSLNEYQLKSMTEIKYSLEQYFKEIY